MDVCLDRRDTINELKKLANIRCRDCGGRGHAARDCNTRHKLTVLGKRNRVSNQIVAEARKTVGRAYQIAIRPLRNQVDAYSRLPNAHRVTKREKAVLLRKVGRGEIAKGAAGMYASD